MVAVKAPLIFGRGTPEPLWQRWLTNNRLPQLGPSSLFGGCRRLVVVAPHPDDEVLGAAGLLQHAGLLGMSCTVIAVSDGEASHPGSSLWTPLNLAHARAKKSAHALALLVPEAWRIRLGFPDGRIGEHMSSLKAKLSALLQPTDALCCTWRYDGHPDHEATGRACAAVAETLGCPLLEVPIWAWHWAAPGDERVPWARAVGVPLNSRQMALKCQALACFHSQLRPDPSTGGDAILPEWATERLLRPFEVVFR